MHIARLHTLVEQVFGKVFSHALRERSDEHALLLLHAYLRFVNDVVNLRFDRLHRDLGIEKTGRTNDLLDHALAHALFVIARRGRGVDELRDALLEFIETKRTIIQARWQAKAVFCKRGLA